MPMTGLVSGHIRAKIPVITVLPSQSFFLIDSDFLTCRGTSGSGAAQTLPIATLPRLKVVDISLSLKCVIPSIRNHCPTDIRLLISGSVSATTYKNRTLYADHLR